MAIFKVERKELERNHEFTMVDANDNGTCGVMHVVFPEFYFTDAIFGTAAVRIDWLRNREDRSVRFRWVNVVSVSVLDDEGDKIAMTVDEQVAAVQCVRLHIDQMHDEIAEFINCEV